MQNSGNVVAAFSEEDASRLTGVSRTQLRYWDRQGFYKPAYGSSNFSGFARVYSFKDIVALRVLDTLRNQFRVKLGHLREVKQKLGFLAEDDRWTGVKLYPLNGRVVWIEQNTGIAQEILSGQYVVPVVIDLVIADTHERVASLNKRDASVRGHIERVRNVSHNEPIFVGTRITVAAIKRYLAAGYSTEFILSEYPDLTVEDVNAAMTINGPKTVRPSSRATARKG
jgi:uncharacterized protein (DUF433 family)